MEPIITFSDLSQFEGRIRKFEAVDGLTLYHYNNDAVDINSNPLLKQIRGIVFDENENLIMRGFPYTPEFLHDDPNLGAHIGNIAQYQTCLSFEGTIVRVFFYKNKWYVSTHKKIDADNSYWASRDVSFGELFRQAVDQTIAYPDSFLKMFMQGKGIANCTHETFFDVLDKQKQYMFLLEPRGENRIVAATGISVPMQHVGTFIENHFCFDDYIGISKPARLQFQSIEDLTTFVAGIDPLWAQGVLLMSPNGFFKVTSKMYAFLYQLRGNQPNLKMRFLELRNEPARIEAFMRLYPEFTSIFTDLQKKLDNLIKIIHTAYVNRFIQKKMTVLPQPQYFFLSKVHNNYKETGIKTTLERVKHLLTFERAVHVYRMIFLDSM